MRLSQAVILAACSCAGCGGEAQNPIVETDGSGRPALCGNGQEDPGEECDGNVLCSGKPGCTADCKFDRTVCPSGQPGGIGSPEEIARCIASIPSFEAECASCACSACTGAMQACSDDPSCVALRNCA